MASDDIAVQVWQQFYRLSHRLMQLGTTHLSRYDLTPPQFYILEKLIEGEELIQQDLADRLMVSKGNISQILKIMEQKALIERIPDGASNRILLTDRARKMLDVLMPELNAFVRANLAELSEHEQMQLLQLLKRFEDSII
jgi:DNA-binding MarR family transcriptional regulator